MNISKLPTIPSSWGKTLKKVASTVIAATATIALCGGAGWLVYDLIPTGWTIYGTTTTTPIAPKVFAEEHKKAAAALICGAIVLFIQFVMGSRIVQIYLGVLAISVAFNSGEFMATQTGLKVLGLEGYWLWFIPTLFLLTSIYMGQVETWWTHRFIKANPTAELWAIFKGTYHIYALHMGFVGATTLLINTLCFIDKFGPTFAGFTYTSPLAWIKAITAGCLSLTLAVGLVVIPMVSSFFASRLLEDARTPNDNQPESGNETGLIWNNRRAA